MQRILQIALLTFAINGFSQTYSSITSDDEIYAFLNDVIKYENKYKEEKKYGVKNVNAEIVPWEARNFIPKDNADANDLKYIYKSKGGIDTIFKAADRTALLQQFKAIKDDIWHQKFKLAKLVTNDIKPNRYSFSVPLFSADKKYAVVQKKFDCGKDCIYAGVCFYTKNANGEWESFTCVNCKE